MTVITKKIDPKEPILPFAPVTNESEFPNPHSVALLLSVNHTEKTILCCCQNGGGNFMLHFDNFKEESLPFERDGFVLIQQKFNASGPNILKVKDAGIDVSWHNGMSYTPIFTEAMIVTLVQQNQVPMEA